MSSERYHDRHRSKPAASKSAIERRQLLRAILGTFVIFVTIIAIKTSPGFQPLRAQSNAAPTVDKSTIGGTVVNSATGKPEAGVWLIAETRLGYLNHIQYHPNPFAN